MTDPDYSWLPGVERSLGAQRMAELMTSLAMLHAQTDILVLGIGFARDQGYRDEYLDTIRQDASDVANAATTLRNAVHALADRWQAQRQEHTPKEDE